MKLADKLAVIEEIYRKVKEEKNESRIGGTRGWG